MHGGAHGQYDVGDLLGNAGLLGHLHVGGDGRHAGAGAEGHRRRPEQVAEHDAGRALTAAEAGIDGEEHEHVHKAQDVVQDQGPAVVADELGAVGGHQAGEEAEEADGSIVGDDLDGLHDAVGHIGQELCGLGLGAAGHLDAEAEKHRRHDQGQNGPAAPQLGEVGLGEEVDEHVGQAQGIADLALHDLIGVADHGDDPGDHIHDDRGKSGGDEEGRNGDAHDLAGALDALHVGDGRCDGAEYHGHHNAEHQVDEHGAQGLEAGGVGPQDAHDAAGYNTCQHAQQKSVAFPE